MGGAAADGAISEKTAAPERAVNNLSFLLADDALCLFKNSITLLKLLNMLRTTHCSGSPALKKFDEVQRCGLSRLLNVDLATDQRK